MKIFIFNKKLLLACNLLFIEPGEEVIVKHSPFISYRPRVTILAFDIGDAMGLILIL